MKNTVNSFIVLVTMLLAFTVFDVQAISTDETKEKADIYISNYGEGLGDRLMQVNEQSSNLSKRSMLINFCSEILAHGTFTGDILEGKPIQYNPSQSIFLSIICNSVAPSLLFDEQLENGDEGYVKSEKNTLVGLGLICEPRTADDVGDIYQPLGCVPGCELNGNMNQCDFSLLVPKVLREINNDLTNMGLGMAYGITNISDENVSDSEIANMIGARYFSTILCNKPGGSCKYPKTHNSVMNFIKQAQKLILKTSIINSKNILASSKTCTNPEIPDNLWSCMFGGHNIILAPIVDNMYNELFFYEMFMAYYKSYLSSRPYIGEFEVGINIRHERAEQTAEEIERINFESTMHLRAVSTSQRMLMQVYTYFPLHLGFLLYHEAVVSFRDTAAKLYTPLDQLRYKFTNVQDDSQ